MCFSAQCSMYLVLCLHFYWIFSRLMQVILVRSAFSTRLLIFSCIFCCTSYPSARMLCWFTLQGKIPGRVMFAFAYLCIFMHIHMFVHLYIGTCLYICLYSYVCWLTLTFGHLRWWLGTDFECPPASTEVGHLCHSNFWWLKYNWTLKWPDLYIFQTICKLVYLLFF